MPYRRWEKTQYFDLDIVAIFTILSIDVTDPHFMANLFVLLKKLPSKILISKLIYLVRRAHPASITQKLHDKGTSPGSRFEQKCHEIPSAHIIYFSWQIILTYLMTYGAQAGIQQHNRSLSYGHSNNSVFKFHKQGRRVHYWWLYGFMGHICGILYLIGMHRLCCT